MAGGVVYESRSYLRKDTPTAPMVPGGGGGIDPSISCCSMHGLAAGFCMEGASPTLVGWRYLYLITRAVMASLDGVLSSASVGRTLHMTSSNSTTKYLVAVSVSVLSSVRGEVS